MKVLYSFGRADQLDRSAIERLITALTRVVGVEAGPDRARVVGAPGWSSSSPARWVGPNQRSSSAAPNRCRSCYCSHIAARDSFTALTALADVAPHVTLGVTVAPIYHRSPASMAQTAATVDDVTGGRFRLGLGVGHRVTMANWHGQEIGSPLAEMREYVAAVRALLAGEPATDGSRWRSTFAFGGFTPRADLPIDLAGLSPAMVALAGEIADGIVLWACPASYVRDVVVPTVREARTAAGKDPDTFAVIAAVPAAATDDPERAIDGMRGELVRYFGLPFYRRMFAAAGYERDIAAYDAAGSDAARRQAIGPEFIADLCAVGDAGAVADGVARYRAAGPPVTPMISNVPGTDFVPTLQAAAREPAARSAAS